MNFRRCKFTQKKSISTPKYKNIFKKNAKYQNSSPLHSTHRQQYAESGHASQDRL